MIGLPNFDLTSPTDKQKFVEYIISLMRNEIIMFTSSYNNFSTNVNVPDNLLVNNHKIGLDELKPAAGDVTPGTYYTSTDIMGGTTYRSDGIDWVAVAAGVTPGDLTGDVTSVGLATSIAPNVIVDADVNASAAISYSKLNLATSIVNADIAVSAAIAYSKLNLALSIVNADINEAAAITYSKLNLNNSIVNGDIISLAWSKITSTPTTLSGYGITDAVNSVTTRTANTIFSGPTTGVAVAPTFRALVAADIPTLTLAKISDAGTAAAKNIPATGNASATEVVYGSDTRLTTAAANQVVYKNSSNVAVGNATFTFDTSALYVPYLKVNSASGDEGGQIDLIKPVTNTTLSTGVSIDVYQDKLRIFDGGGTNKGYYLDMATAAASAASQIVSKDASGNFSAGTITAALTGTASKASNIVGGLGGSIPYQTAVDATALLANGTAGQVLSSAGTTLAPTWTTATNANTASAIVKRDGSGNFTAGTITATTFSGALSGNATTATTATTSGSCSGNALTATTTTRLRRTDNPAYYIQGDSGGWDVGGVSGIQSGSLYCGSMSVDGTINTNGNTITVGSIVSTNVRDNVGVTYRDCYISSGGVFGVFSSSRRYKENIIPYSFDINKVLSIEPVSFTYKAEFTDDDSINTHYGVIAEQAEEVGLTEFVMYDEDGQAASFEYKLFTVALLDVCKKQQVRIDDLELRLAALEAK